MSPPTLRTARLVLRPFAAADAPSVRRLAGERAVARTTLTIPHPYPEGAAEAWIAGHAPAWAQGRGVSWAITLDDTLIGEVGLSIAAGEAELGYWMGVPWWNRGYATEAATAAVRFGFTGLGLRRIHSRHFAMNPASGAVMRKLGMRHEGRLPEPIIKDGAPQEVECYGLLATDLPPPAGPH